MKKLAVIYHSAHGHTEHIAIHVTEGAQSMPDTEVHLVKADDLTSMPNILLEQHRCVPYVEAANRLCSWSGLMTQAVHSAAADSFVVGDIRTARMFGRNFADTAHRISNEPRN